MSNNMFMQVHAAHSLIGPAGNSCVNSLNSYAGAVQQSAISCAQIQRQVPSLMQLIQDAAEQQRLQHKMQQQQMLALGLPSTVANIPSLYSDSSAVDHNYWVSDKAYDSAVIKVAPAHNPIQEDPLHGLYVKGSENLNWKLIHDIADGKIGSTVPSHCIATALIQAKECGFRESAKR